METLTTTDTIAVELTGPRDCSDLIAFLERFGLEASLCHTNDSCLIEIGFAPSPDPPVKVAVRHALVSWLAEHETPLVLAETDDRSYVLRPAAD